MNNPSLAALAALSLMTGAYRDDSPVGYPPPRLRAKVKREHRRTRLRTKMQKSSRRRNRA